MNTRKLVLLFTALLGLTVSAFAETQTTEASVAKMTGKATMTLPNGTSSELTIGAKVPQGATIVTADGSEVYLLTHASTWATIKANSTVSVDTLSVDMDGGKVTKENTTLNLKSGNLVSALDPTKRSVNNYQVRTPKGVAAARGTTFTVTVNGENYSIVTTSGTVTITNITTGAVVSISGGQASVSTVNNGASTAVADLPPAEKATAVQAMAVAVATIAVAVENNIGGTTAAELRSVTQTVVASTPEAAAAVNAQVQATVPSQAAAVQQAVRETPATPTTTPVTTPTPPATTPQPIDPSTVSRSNE